jgi:hypothetical protein
MPHHPDPIVRLLYAERIASRESRTKIFSSKQVSLTSPLPSVKATDLGESASKLVSMNPNRRRSEPIVKTDQLIDILSTNLEPVKSAQFKEMLAGALDALRVLLIKLRISCAPYVCILPFLRRAHRCEQNFRTLERRHLQAAASVLGNKYRRRGRKEGRYGRHGHYNGVSRFSDNL